MNYSPREPQLFEVYAGSFEVLTKCLFASVAVLFAVTLVLIILFCREDLRRFKPAKKKVAVEPVRARSRTPRLRSKRLRLARAIASLGITLSLSELVNSGGDGALPPALRVPLGLDELIP